MGTNNIPSATDGTVIPSSDHNAVQEAFANDLVPRNTSGVPTANQGDLGTSTYPFKRAEITSGYFFPGQIISMHTYNGLLSPGHGWMKCDGRQVTEANYNTEHGAGSWATYIGSSPLDTKYLPGSTGGVYLVGAAATTQTGVSAITEVGNANSQISVGTHTHTGPNHNHVWLLSSGSTTVHDKSYNSGGSQVDLQSAATGKSSGYYCVLRNSTAIASASAILGTHYTNNGGSGATGADGAITNKNIQPASIQVIHYMRII